MLRYAERNILPEGKRRAAQMKEIWTSSLLLVVFLLLMTAPGRAQECTPEILAQKPGQWRKVPDFNHSRFPKELVGHAKSVVELFSKLILEVYPQPEGCEARWYGRYDSSDDDTGLVQSYQFTSLFLMYLCSANQQGFVRSDETNDWIYVVANYGERLNGFLTVNGKRFSTMKRPSAVKDGMLYFEYPNSASSPDEKGLWINAWMITYPGKLPYVPVTRKEYLQEARQEVAKTQIEAIERVKKTTRIRPAAEQEAAKNREVEYLRKSYPDSPRRWQRYLEDYRTDEQRLQETIDHLTEQHQATIDMMDDLLRSLSPEELQKPAVVSVIATAFKGFEDDFKGRNANMLIRWNPDYFDKKLSRAAPQFITVLIREERRDIPFVGVTRLLKQKFRFDALSSMLGK